jgi:hypothetical protein
VSRSLRIAIALALLSGTCAACGTSGNTSGTSSSSGSSGRSTFQTYGEASPPTPTLPTGSPADAPTLAAISKAYATFFSSTSTTAQSQSVLQHGEKFTQALEEQAKSSYARTASAKVDAARLTSPNVAAVTFTVLSNGTALLPGASGYAVRTGGRWQVAAQTFCGLLALQGGAPDACHDPAITALPH